MDLGLKGKNAIVTGATRGIGRAIAETLAAEGCNVAICARDGAAVEAAVSALRKRGVKAAGQVLSPAACHISGANLVVDGAFTRRVN